MKSFAGESFEDQKSLDTQSQSDSESPLIDSNYDDAEERNPERAFGVDSKGG